MHILFHLNDKFLICEGIDTHYVTFFSNYVRRYIMFAILLKEVNDSKLINNNFGNSLIFKNFHIRNKIQFIGSMKIWKKWNLKYDFYQSKLKFSERLKSVELPVT